MLPEGEGVVVRVLVTGGCGFVGSHIFDRLMADGHDVTILDNHASKVCYQPQAHLDGRVIQADVGRFGDYVEELPRLDAVVHAAAYADLRNNWTRPKGQDHAERLRHVRTNVRGTAELLEAIPDVPVIYLSSASVYGSQPGRVCGEDDASPATCESPYAATKFAAEGIVAAYAHKRGAPWYALRLVNVVGARSHRGVIADFVRMMNEKGCIHAADDGRQKKSWVHVLDVAGAVARVLTRSSNADHVNRSEDVPSGVYNVTSVDRLSWWDVVDAMGVPRSRVTHESRSSGAVGDPLDLHVSGAKLSPYFRPRRPVLLDGVREALGTLGWTSTARVA